MIFSKKHLLIILVLSLSVYGQSKNNSFVIPLKNGKNPMVVFKSLKIEPLNLFVQSTPINNNSPHTQLELNVSENNKKSTIFLWYFKNDNVIKTNYPKAFGKYNLSLSINKKEKIALVIEKLDYEKEFFINLKQTITIANIKIFFKESIGEWSVDIDGNQVDAFNTYSIVVSEENKEKTISFTSNENGHSLKWENNEIFLLDNNEKNLKLMVRKKK